MDPKRPPQLLRGKRVVLLFYESSTRTRTSFEFAAKALGATTTLITATSSSIEKGESLIDTGGTITSLGADAIVIRHPNSGAPYLLARHVPVPVVNAGDGMHQHPSQALLDALTIAQPQEAPERIARGDRGRCLSQPGGAIECGVAVALWSGGYLLRSSRFCARKLRPRIAPGVIDVPRPERRVAGRGCRDVAASAERAACRASITAWTTTLPITRSRRSV